VPDQSVAVVIVSFNVKDELDACLTSFVGHTQPFPTAVIVVDNQSSDGTAAMLRRRWPHVHLIEAGRNLGFAAANNMAIRASASAFVLLLNPDTIVPPGSIQELVRALATRPDAAVAGPRLKDERGFPELSFGWTISPLGELRQKIVGGLHRRKVRPVVRMVDGWSRMPGEREWVSGAALLVRREDLEAVNLLDERFFMYTEDVDLCVSLRLRGRKILYVPQAEIVHLRGRSAGRNAATQALRRRSQIAYYEKHHPGWAPVLRLYLWIVRRHYTD
jgi:N-acetylglucosaminyl-diphospho-decaprenol L-rhamnosyltransferase